MYLNIPKTLFTYSRKSNTNCTNTFPDVYLMLRPFGIDRYTTKTTRTKGVLLKMARYLTAITWTVSILALISMLYTQSFSKEDMKSISSRCFQLLSPFAMWYYLLQKNARITLTIKDVEETLGLSLPKQLVKAACASIFLLYASHVLLTIRTYDDMSWRSLFHSITFDLLDSSVTSDSPIAITIARGYIVITTYGTGYYPLSFSLFCAILCYKMSNILSRYTQIIEKKVVSAQKTCAEKDACFELYGSIVSKFQDLNSALSFPAFTLIIHNANGMFYASLYVLIDSDNKAPAISYLILSFLSFTLTVFTASAVNEIDKTAKELNFKILRISELGSEHLKKDSVIKLADICVGPPFALSGYGCFEFKRSVF